MKNGIELPSIEILIAGQMITNEEDINSIQECVCVRKPLCVFINMGKIDRFLVQKSMLVAAGRIANVHISSV